MNVNWTKMGSRASAPFFLVLLLLFASYRPAVCLLSMSSLRSDADPSAPLFPNQNKPRPSRQQCRAAVEEPSPLRCSIEEAKHRPSSVAELSRATVNASASDRAAKAAVIQPDYLKPFLRDLPYNHLSPPV